MATRAARSAAAAAIVPLVIHGLWPERMEPRTYPRDCPAPPLDLEPALALELADLMPGMADGLHTARMANARRLQRTR